MSHSVFISNQSRQHDYDKAREFGALRAITSGNYAIFKTARLREEIVEALIHSEKDDYLLLSGSSVIAGMCMAVWVLMHGQVNLLLYDRTAKEYVERKFTRDDTLKELERARDQFEASKG